MAKRPKQQFGHTTWTEIKLECVRAYLDRYLIALKYQPFEKLYIDAFAGTGYVEVRSHNTDQTLLADAFDSELTSRQFIEGSARLALATNPPFDQYIFIEKCPNRAAELACLSSEYSDRRILVVNGEANERIRANCSGKWGNRRGVMFLDPFGMQVEWDTLNAIAKTQAIDMWYLFPLMGLNRHLCRNGKKSTPDARQAINRLLGCTEWEDAFYETRTEPNLFETVETTEKIADFECLSEFIVNRLKSIFPGVAPNPLLLTTPKNTALFLLCFAAANPVGAPIAVNIASHILGHA